MKNINDTIKINFALDTDLNRLVELIKVKYNYENKREAVNKIIRLYSETQEGKDLLSLLEGENYLNPTVVKPPNGEKVIEGGDSPVIKR